MTNARGYAMTDYKLNRGGVTADGMRIDYLEAGPPDGPPLVFLHGIGGGVEDWWANLGHFAEQGYRVLAPSLPGHGASDPPPRTWNPEEAGSTVLQLMDAWGVADASLVGHSAGGILALQATLLAPDRVKSLILVSPGGMGRKIGWVLRLLTIPVLGEVMWQPWTLEASRARKMIFADQSLVNEEIMDLWLKRHRDLRQRRVFFRLLRRGINLRGLKSSFDMRLRLGEISCPTVVIWGREDQVIPFPQTENGEISAFPAARLVSLSPCGHWPQVEQAATFNREIEESLRALKTR